MKNTMNSFVTDIATNKIIQSVFFSYFTANVIKILIRLTTSDKFDLKLFFKTGGMPSAHSATVSAMATAVYILEGMSNLFAVALMFCIVVVADAIGIRRAAGRQAVLLNKIIDEFQSSGQFKAERLYELIGHTPTEVFVGVLLGILITQAVFRF